MASVRAKEGHCLRWNVRRQRLRSTCRARTQRAASSSQHMPDNLRNIVQMFQIVPDPMQRYKQLLHYATKLEKLPEEYHTDDYKVEGCVSQVWVVPEYEEGRMHYLADSDSQLTKGLAALLCNGLSGAPADQIINLTPDFIEELGLKQSLTPSRNNGFLNMFKKMQRQAIDMHAAGDDGHGETQSRENGDGVNPESLTPVADSIQSKLEKELQPRKLNVIDESAAHAHHEPVQNLSRSTETHFTIEVVSDEFEGKRKVQRHRTVYNLLDDEIRNGIHALSLHLKSPSEAGM